MTTPNKTQPTPVDPHEFIESVTDVDETVLRELVVAAYEDSPRSQQSVKTPTATLRFSESTLSDIGRAAT